MTISKHSKQMSFEELSSLPEDTRANLLVLPGSKEARKMTATSGQRCCELYERQGLIGSLQKTLLATLDWGSTKCFLTWRVRHTPQGASLFQLVPSMPPTEEIESGSSPEIWATPRTSDGTGGPRPLDERSRRISRTNPDLKFGANLADQVRMWPTPVATAHKGWSPGHNRADTNDRLDYTVEREAHQAQTGGKLNQTWVEWLMGYPIGWTDLGD